MVLRQPSESYILGTGTSIAALSTVILWKELTTFVYFLWNPTTGRCLVSRCTGNVQTLDWYPSTNIVYILFWSFFLWLINLSLLGPLSSVIASRFSANFRPDICFLSWFRTIFFAPVVEEMLFRYNLRYPKKALWTLPVIAALSLNDTRCLSFIIIGLTVIGIKELYFFQSSAQSNWDIRLSRCYRNHFGLIFHGVALVFAAIHLNNFELHTSPYWAMPILVLPQWFTGLVLGWIRVNRGIGVSIVLHMFFNGGIVMLTKFVPSVAN